MHDLRFLWFSTLLFLFSVQSFCHAQSRLDEAPIHYTETKGENRVSAMIDKVDSGELDLIYEDGYGYLRSILAELQVPVSSQALVFSKTSLQTGRISPTNPRAIFFGDDVYVGWVRGSSLLEVSAADPKLGAVYYTINMSPRRPSMRRENFRCLGCHERTDDHGKVPVHTIQSVMARSNGKINLLLDSFVTDHTSPIAERWGGWYVTGGHGLMKHMGNAFLEGDQLVSLGPSNAETLQGQFDLSRWPVASSDIVALMVLEHQVEMHNQLASANYAVRRARNRSTDTDGGVADLDSVIDRSAKKVVDHLLFVDEAKLESPISCSNTFTDDFATKGPTTRDGRSLRQFDLKRRLFRYPCSYTIYSPAFAALDSQLKDRVFQRLWQVLSGQDVSPEYGHLSSQDRGDILQILRATVDDPPASWTATAAS
ncbi:hypothetical protein [Stieleria mannarensis]|uniref:hypothetical protein n=1 Tax=Stieleria mannarensis TaxID=2755585 RepID=UPI001601D56C|nr:hypothetical protein [Rhodopirellula sp. JC639]